MLESTGFFTATFWPLAEGTGEVTAEVTGEVTARQVGPEVHLLRVIEGDMSRQALLDALGLKHAEHFRKVYLLPAVTAGVIEMTIPDKPRSPKQRYRITSLGLEVLKKTSEACGLKPPRRQP